MFEVNRLASRGRLYRRGADFQRRSAGGNPCGKCARWPSGDRRFAAAGQIAASARLRDRRKTRSRNRHAWRLLDDLAGAGAWARAARSSPSKFDAHHAEVARANIAREGMSATRRSARRRRARRVCRSSKQSAAQPFDLAFIDADKPNNAAYFDYALKLSRPGALIIVDNVVREGAVADPSTTDDGALGARALFDAVAAERRVEATAVQTVGSQGLGRVSDRARENSGDAPP